MGMGGEDGNVYSLLHVFILLFLEIFIKHSFFMMEILDAHLTDIMIFHLIKYREDLDQKVPFGFL
jgi:hypothetical protein